MWPPQVNLVIGAIVPKPRGRDTTLGLSPCLAKLWAKTRSAATLQWTSEADEHWDTAIRGSSALQAALVRG
eukprot:3668360-Pyramimonas_sp.AAC.1